MNSKNLTFFFNINYVLLHKLKGDSGRTDEGLGSELCIMKGEKGNTLTTFVSFVPSASKWKHSVH
jgi:hypothetical protein